MGAFGAAEFNVAETSKSSEPSREQSMRQRVPQVLGLAIAFLLACGLAFAHHGSSNYDLSKSVSVKGAIRQFDFMNPHSAIRLESRDDMGHAEQWLIEADSPNNLARAGWTRESLKPGDQVTIVGNRLKDGAKVMRLQKVIFSDGKELKPREGDEY
jgi:hypothetical protein